MNCSERARHAPSPSTQTRPGYRRRGYQTVGLTVPATDERIVGKGDQDSTPTCWGLKDANLAILNTIIQCIHKLQLDVVGLVGMMENSL